MTITPPPTGVQPRFLWLEERRDAIYRAIERFRKANYVVPVDWLEELIGLEREIQLRQTRSA